jgi:hypothetical protein
MPTGNQDQGRRNEGGRDRNNGGAQPSGESQAQNFQQSVRQGVEQAADRLREGYGDARDEMARRYRHAEGMVARNPGSSVLIGFGLGFGLGLALTVILTQEEESWADRYLPDSLRRFPESVHRMKKRGIEAARDSHAAETIQDTFHHLAESIRDLPAMVAKMMPGH